MADSPVHHVTKGSLAEAWAGIIFHILQQGLRDSPVLWLWPQSSPVSNTHKMQADGGWAQLQLHKPVTSSETPGTRVSNL